MRKRTRKIGLALNVFWLVLVGTTKAGPPFVTDDPEVPPVGGWEINIPFTLNRTPGLTQMNAPLLDFNYGLPQLQLEFDIPIAVSSDDRKGTNAGLGDLLYVSSTTRTATWRRPAELHLTATSRKELGQMDLVRQHRLPTANCSRPTRLLVCRQRVAARYQ
jgi:hypothetical protein